MQRNCICNEIFQADHDQCETSTKYLCEQRANPGKAKFVLDGQEVTRETALQSFRQMLKEASYPLITGLNAIGSRSQRTAVAIGRKYRAAVESGEKPSPTSLSLARAGSVTASMGEIVQRSDRLLLLACDPINTHPRFFNSIVNQNGSLEIGCWGCNGLRQPSSTKFDLASKNLEHDLMLLLAAIKNAKVNKNVSAEKIQVVRQLHDWLVSGRFVSVLLGPLAESSVDTVTEICKALTSQVRIVSVNLSVQSNSIGAEHTLAATTGFADAIDFSAGYARSFHSEFSSSKILARREADLLITFDEKLVTPEYNIPTITFGATNDASRKADQPILRIENLSVLGDDFHRFDHLQFGVCRSPASNDLQSFLKDV